jgi:hypothetical protein
MAFSLTAWPSSFLIGFSQLFCFFISNICPATDAYMGNMGKNLLACLFCCCFYQSNAQIFIEPLAGYGIDLMNKPELKQINTSVQLAFRKKRSELFVFVQKTWPGGYSSYDSSFTVNPSLPLYTSARKKVSPNSLSLGFGYRGTLVGRQTKPHLSLLLFTALSYQKIAITYNYDKSNYTILNPDKTQKTTSLIGGIGLQYSLPVKKGQLFLQAVVTSPPATKIKYPSSFLYSTTLSFDVGYSFQLKRHEEK